MTYPEYFDDVPKISLPCHMKGYIEPCKDCPLEICLYDLKTKEDRINEGLEHEAILSDQSAEYHFSGD